MILADKLEKTPANKNINYWSPLSCLVEEQEEDDDELSKYGHRVNYWLWPPPVPMGRWLFGSFIKVMVSLSEEVSGRIYGSSPDTS